MSKILLRGILLVCLILVLAAYVIVNFVEDKVFEISDIIAIVGILILILLGILQYLQNEKVLKLNAQALKDQKQARFDAMVDDIVDDTMEKLIQSHNDKHSKKMNE